MLLAGGQGSRLGVLTSKDLDKNIGGVSVLPPYEKVGKTEWYTGTANAVYQNLAYMESFNPEYVLILSGDHIYKMDYEVMLDFHKAHGADVSIVVSDENGKIQEFQEKPEEPKSNLASMGIYIFTWKALKEALVTLRDQSNCDFGKHVIPYCHKKGQTLVAYEYNGYWKDVGTLGSYWEANMELIDIIPEFNLYEEFWKIYTKNDILPPQFVSEKAVTERCLIGDGSEIYGSVYNSIIGCGVIIEEGAVVRDSIIMQNTVIKQGAVVNKAIIAEGSVIGEGAELGAFEEVPNRRKPSVYAFGLAVVGENTVIPSHVKIGKNTAVTGITVPEDYPDGILKSGGTLDKAGDIQ